jgi:hypothetical protein
VRDLSGAEPQVLRGAIAVGLRRARPWLLPTKA